MVSAGSILSCIAGSEALIFLKFLSTHAMAPSLAELTGLPSTSASFMYVVESACHQYEDPYQIVGVLPAEQEEFRSNVHFEEHANIPVFDLRSCSEILSLERHGIELMHCGKMPPVDVRTTAGVEAYLGWIVDAMKKKFSPELIIVYNYNVSTKGVGCSER